MTSFKVKWHRKALKELRALPKGVAKQLVLKAKALHESPMAASFPLAGCDYRKIRAGDYRALLEVMFKEKLVRILLVGHRKKVYKRFFSK